MGVRGQGSGVRVRVAYSTLGTLKMHMHADVYTSRRRASYILHRTCDASHIYITPNIHQVRAYLHPPDRDLPSEATSSEDEGSAAGVVEEV